MKDKNKFQDYTPLNQGVVIRLLKYSGKVKLTPEAERQAMRDLFMEVLAVSDDITDIEPGDGVYFPQDVNKDMMLPLKHFEKKENGEDVEYDVAQIRRSFILGVRKGLYSNNDVA
jgi:hypothetical protein